MPHVSNLSLYVNTVCDRKREKEEVDHQSSPRQLRKEMIEREELRLENYGDNLREPVRYHQIRISAERGIGGTPHLCDLPSNQ